MYQYSTRPGINDQLHESSLILLKPFNSSPPLQAACIAIIYMYPSTSCNLCIYGPVRPVTEPANYIDDQCMQSYIGIQLMHQLHTGSYMYLHLSFLLYIYKLDILVSWIQVATCSCQCVDQRVDRYTYVVRTNFAHFHAQVSTICLRYTYISVPPSLLCMYDIAQKKKNPRVLSCVHYSFLLILGRSQGS